MRRIRWLLLAVQAALVTAFLIGLRSRRMPLGVPGEWEWQRIIASPSAGSIALGFAAIGLYAAFAAVGFGAMSRQTRPPRVKRWLLGLVLAAVALQGAVQEAAPEGYGLSKWILALHSPGSSGYYTVAKQQMADPWRFLANYPTWIAKQDALHVGTHPPGLFVAAKASLSLMERDARLSRWVCEYAPGSAAPAIRTFRESMNLTRADAASLALTGALTLLACASAVVPIYALARSTLTAGESWAAAALWPLVPSALMFQPAADTAFPLFSSTALAMAAWSVRADTRHGLALCVLSGLVLAVGMACTLAFLPVGLVVAIVLFPGQVSNFDRRIKQILATGVGFLAGTLAWWAATAANPFAIWWINKENHARFYVEYPRTFAAWVVENPIELAVALGLPTAAWALVGLFRGWQAPRVAWGTLLVLVALTLSGKNLSEVARLWLPLMPPLLVAAGAGLGWSGGGGRTLGASIALVGLQVLVLEATIQVVYPV